MDILLLGNGFDLYHFLPTRYKDFLLLTDVITKHNHSEIETLGKIINDSALERDDFLDAVYNKYKTVYDLIKLTEEDYAVLNKMKENCWFRYFLSCFNKDIGWIDFEKEIAMVISVFKKFIKPNDSNFKIIESDYDKSDYYIFSYFDFFHRYHKVNNDNGIWSMVASPYYEILEEYRVEKPFGSNVFIVDYGKIIDGLYIKLTELAEAIKVYIKVFVDETIPELLNSNVVYKSDLFRENDVVSFNYSNTYELLYGGKVQHIHGKVNDDIVLGVNSDNDDEIGYGYEEAVDTLFVKFKKYYQRVVKKTEEPYIALKRKIEDNKQIFRKTSSFEYDLYAFGHSLDKTDEDVIKYMFSIADKIKIYYHSNRDFDDKVLNLISIYGREEFDDIRYSKNMEFIEIGD